MSFLDNLENTLKGLESQEERDPNEQSRRESERARVLAAAPWAEKLKQSSYKEKLLEQATLKGHQLRAKVYMAWLDTALRLEVKDRQLELRPTPEGIIAVFLENRTEVRTQPVDLEGKPQDLIEQWLG